MRRLWHRLFGHGIQVFYGVVPDDKTVYTVSSWCDVCEGWA